MEKLQTIAGISQLLSIPESTLRYQAKLFTDFLPTQGTSRKKRFLPSCVERFAYIDDLYNNGVITEDIDSLRSQLLRATWPWSETT